MTVQLRAKTRPARPRSSADPHAAPRASVPTSRAVEPASTMARERGRIADSVRVSTAAERRMPTEGRAVSSPAMVPSRMPAPSTVGARAVTRPRASTRWPSTRTATAAAPPSSSPATRQRRVRRAISTTPGCSVTLTVTTTRRASATSRPTTATGTASRKSAMPNLRCVELLVQARGSRPVGFCVKWLRQDRSVASPVLPSPSRAEDAVRPAAPGDVAASRPPTRVAGAACWPRQQAGALLGTAQDTP